MKLNGTHTLDEINELFDKQGGLCNCCREVLTDKNKHLDHIMPLALEGSNYIENLQWLCQFCNSSKSDRHPDEWAVYSASPEFKERREKRKMLQ